MPIEFSWIIPNHVLEQRQIGHITKEEYLAGIHEANRWMDSSPEKELHLLSNNQEATSADVTMKELKESLKHVHPRLGFTLSLYPDNPQLIPLVNLLASMLSFFAPIRLKLFKTKAEALAFLFEQRPFLRPLLPASERDDAPNAF